LKKKLAVEAVYREPFSGPIPCLQGILQGFSGVVRVVRCALSRKNEENRRFCSNFGLHEQGIFIPHAGKIMLPAGILFAEEGTGVLKPGV
jgi:hypothetical protein